MITLLCYFNEPTEADAQKFEIDSDTVEAEDIELSAQEFAEDYHDCGGDIKDKRIVYVQRIDSNNKNIGEPIEVLIKVYVEYTYCAELLEKTLITRNVG